MGWLRSKDPPEDVPPPLLLEVVVVGAIEVEVEVMVAARERIAGVPAAVAAVATTTAADELPLNAAPPTMLVKDPASEPELLLGVLSRLLSPVLRPPGSGVITD